MHIRQVQNSCVLAHVRSFVKYKQFTIEQEDSDCEITICFGAVFNQSEDLTVIVPLRSLSIYLCTILHYLNGGHVSKLTESGIDFGIYLTSLSQTVCGIVHSSCYNVYVFLGEKKTFAICKLTSHLVSNQRLPTRHKTLINVVIMMSHRRWHSVVSTLCIFLGSLATDILCPLVSSY